MVYETFLTTITQQLQNKLGANYTLSVRTFPKNNGVKLEGLVIKAPGDLAAPTVYLDPYFEQYQKGMSMKEIIDDIIHLVHTTPLPCSPTSEEMADFGLLSSKVMFRLIHASSNEELLKDIPHIPYLDLAIVFYLALERTEAGQVTALIHNDHMAIWNQTTKQLWDCARENTPRDLPPQIRTMTDMMKDIARKNLGDDYDEDLVNALLGDEPGTSPLYFLSNITGLYGAGCILYSDVLKNFADRLERDLIILPSSIHEVLLAPDEPGTVYEELSSMVTNINQEDVPMEDQLSNQVYLFSRSDGQLRIVSHGDQSVGARGFSWTAG